VIPPEANAAFVAAMEDVLEVYQRPHDPEYPVVCVDETSKQLVAETRVPVAAKPGQPARYDYEYKRNGTANLFMIFAPLEGRRHVEVTDRHTAVDYAQILKAIADLNFPKAKKIALVTGARTPAVRAYRLNNRWSAPRRARPLATQSAWSLRRRVSVSRGMKTLAVL
jgi:DDE superfamily endonuclease